MQLRRRDADDRHRHIRDPQHGSDRFAIAAEPPYEVAVADDGDGRGAGPVVVRRQRAAGLGVDAEDLELVARGDEARDDLGLAVDAHLKLRRAGEEIDERAVGVAEREVGRIRKRDGRPHSARRLDGEVRGRRRQGVERKRRAV